MGTSSFDAAVALVLKHEGGYVCDPSDPGGATNFGISQRAYPALDIAALTQTDAIAIYQRDYWRPWMDVVDTRLACCLLDCAVNQGVQICAELFAGHPPLLEFQTSRLLHYTQRIVTRPELLRYAHSWFSRTLDVG